MKTQNVLLLCVALLASIPQMDAQQRSFIQTIDVNNEWYILHKSNTFMTQELRVYSFSSDPVEIEGQTYFGLEYYVYDDPENVIQDTNRYYRESDGKVWSVFHGSEEFLLADFSMEVGDIMERAEIGPFYSEYIADKDTVYLLDGQPRTRMGVCCVTDGEPLCNEEGPSPATHYIIEGFIDPFELLKSSCHLWDNLAYDNILICYYENGELVYKANPEEDDCLTVLADNEVSRIGNISVFPNPVDQFLQIDIDITLPDSRIEIWSADGRLLSNSVMNNNILSVQHLMPGIYFLKIKSEKGYYTSKFVKN